jgi:hypothetical protein
VVTRTVISSQVMAGAGGSWRKAARSASIAAAQGNRMNAW